jgi:hypothetical protein
MCVHIVFTSSPADRSSPDPVPIRCTVPRTSTLSTATALPKVRTQFFAYLARTWVCASTLTQQQLACAMLHNAHGACEHTAWQPRPPRCPCKYPLFTARSSDSCTALIVIFLPVKILLMLLRKRLRGFSFQLGCCVFIFV